MAKIILIALGVTMMLFLLNYWFKQSKKKGTLLQRLKNPNMTQEELATLTQAVQDPYTDACFEIFQCKARHINTSPLEIHLIEKYNESFKDNIVRMSVYYGKDEHTFHTYRRMAIEAYMNLLEKKEELQMV